MRGTKEELTGRGEDEAPKNLSRGKKGAQQPPWPLTPPYTSLSPIGSVVYRGRVENSMGKAKRERPSGHCPLGVALKCWRAELVGVATWPMQNAKRQRKPNNTMSEEKQKQLRRAGQAEREKDARESKTSIVGKTALPCASCPFVLLIILTLLLLAHWLLVCGDEGGRRTYPRCRGSV